ncbi:MAG: hypothetical protein A2W85_00370 [Bacteroidetes bacterium GWF2_41_31]|nr:MAG: hypothetical protein A2W85_00370 [Bacteroidetes bacterium GWF2_41_31]
MKKNAILISLIFFFSISNAQDEWTLLHPIPTINDLIDVHFVSDQKGWAVGTEGTILFTENGGTDWETQHSNPDEAFWSVFFIDEMEGWTVGWSKIYHTTDAGATWEQQDRPNVLGDLRDVFFINQDTGWIVGAYKIILRTTDGGQTWNKIMNTISGDLNFNSVHFVDALHGCAVGDKMTGSNKGIVMTTSDGGLNWDETTPDTEQGYQKVTFTNSGIGWVCGGNGTLYKTMDYGVTWVDVSLSNGGFIDIHFFDDQKGLLIEPSQTRQTTDGGETWSDPVMLPGYKSMRGFGGSNENFGLLVGYAGQMYKTSDAGLNWDQISPDNDYPVNQICFFNQTDGLALNSNAIFNSGDLIRTFDGGNTWETDTLIENGPFYMARIFGSTGYLLNSSAQMMKTTNEGNDWQLLSIPENINHFRDLQFTDNNHGFLCGTDGAFYKTNDGGNTWQDMSLSENYNLSDLYFISENAGWVIDVAEKTILKTTNGGVDWTNTTLGDVYIFQPVSIFFKNEFEGFVTSEEGVLFKSDDGGATWNEFYTFSGGYASQILFTSETEGWYKAATKVYHTMDGGISWSNPQSFGYSMIYSMFFLNNNRGWLGGANGMVATYSSTVGMDEFTTNEPGLNVSPNPCVNQVEIKLSDLNNEMRQIIVYNVLGEQVMQYKNLPGSNQFTLNTSELKNGVFILQVNTDNGKNLVKFIKQ